MSREKGARHPPARTPEAREMEVIAAAYDLAERQIREGTATSQVITHFLRLGTQQAKLEREILIEQKKLISAKTESLESQKNLGKMYEDAIRAMKKYSGNGGDDDEDIQ